MPGDSLAERVHNLARFLDQLAEAVNPQSLFLADDAELPDRADQTPRLETLRHILRKDTGNEAEAIIHNLDAGALPQEVRIAAETLRFLTEHGWRPRGNLSLAKLWERLANSASEPQARRRLLISALRQAEQHDDIVRLKKQLEELE
jgi:O-methyltransferase involved in polyketide biosynthesis